MRFGRKRLANMVGHPWGSIYDTLGSNPVSLIRLFLQSRASSACLRLISALSLNILYSYKLFCVTISSGLVCRTKFIIRIVKHHAKRDTSFAREQNGGEGLWGNAQ